MVECHVEGKGCVGFKVHSLNDGKDFLFPHFYGNQLLNHNWNL